ncbi:MAG: hypothetical protein QOE69_3426 [Thermoleophilaceae bacterium]|nr:hypothetical protein [Thermoleophilaceae bacterium]
MGYWKSALGVAALVALMLVAVPTASAARGCAAAKASVSKTSNRALVRATLCVLNGERGRHHLRPLKLSRQLSKAARGHSRAMARRNFFSHTSPSGASFVDRIRRTGYLAQARSWTVGENIAYGSGARSTPRAIATAWMNSSGHRANILSSSFRSIGIGIALGTPGRGGGATYTTDFGRRG